MPTNTPAAAPPRPHPRRAALRSLHPSTLAAITLALLFGGTTLASAANGGSFLLGKTNTETTTATLSNTRGTPLKLSAPTGKAPLAVTQPVMIRNLNAQYTGGLTASQLQPTGFDGFVAPFADIPINSQNFTEITSTGPLPAGIYYVTATAELEAGSGFCWLVRGSDTGTPISIGGSFAPDPQAAETAAVSVAAGDTLQETCEADDNNTGDYVVNAGITAIRILSSHGTPPARPDIPGHAAQRDHGHPAVHPRRPGL